jgi:hypothetical protein
LQIRVEIGGGREGVFERTGSILESVAVRKP